eukprot:Gb_41628 [translate_table: standard]
MSENSVNADQMPISPSSGIQMGSSRLFNRERSVREILGGGIAADVMLWRRRNVSVGILVGAAAAWILFEKSGYTLLSLLANVLLLLIIILFVWANAASVISRPPPPLPELELSEEMVNSTAASIRSRTNFLLTVAHDIALGKDSKLFMKVALCLWLISTVGGWFDFLTLGYMSLVISLTIPALYDKYEDHVDTYAHFVVKEFKKLYLKLDANVISKIRMKFQKGKKFQ